MKARLLTKATLLVFCLFMFGTTIHGALIEQIVCRVNDEIILWSEFENYWQYFKQRNGFYSNDLSLRQQALEEMIEMELMFQMAEEYGISISAQNVNEVIEDTMADLEIETEAEFKEWLQENYGFSDLNLYRNAVKQYRIYSDLIGLIASNQVPDVSITPPTQEEIRNFYDENKNELQVEDQVRLSVILIRVTDEDWSSRSRIRELENRADRVVELAKSGETSFRSLVEEYSDDPLTREKGGDLGYYTRETLEELFPPFAKVAFDELEVGEVSNRIETSNGYHILKKTDYIEGYTIPLEEVRDKIVQQLTWNKAEKKLDELIKYFSQESVIISYLEEVYQ